MKRKKDPTTRFTANTRAFPSAALGLAVILTALLAGCAGTPPANSGMKAPLLIAGLPPKAILPQTELARIAHDIPAKHRQKVIRAEAFGRLVYTRDQLAEQAGRRIAPSGQSPFDYPPAGWVTERTRAGLRLSFIVKEQNKIGVAAEVTRTNGGLKVHRFSTPRPLIPEEIALWKARQVAYSSQFKPCSKRYNPVIVPVRIKGESFIYVFLLPASANPDTVYLGGYHRIVVTPDGKAVLEDHAFTHGCITLRRNAKSVAAKVTEIVSNTPTAPQVYASLRYDLPVRVETVNNKLSWRIKNGHISLAKQPRN
ncbi:MAG: hypothetical protein ACRES9_12075 [Gammaproteobacteria bacterium]